MAVPDASPRPDSSAPESSSSAATGSRPSPRHSPRDRSARPLSVIDVRRSEKKELAMTPQRPQGATSISEA
jgi:hypothetical protein